MTTTYAPTVDRDITDLNQWKALFYIERHRILVDFWLALDPAEVHARFAAAMGLLALVDEELDALQEGLDRFREQFETSR
jgi:hypothetical protein